MTTYMPAPGTAPRQPATPVIPGQNGVPSWVDPRAAAADPAGFQQWMQQRQQAAALRPPAPPNGQPPAGMAPGMQQPATPMVNAVPNYGAAGGVNDQVMAAFRQFMQNQPQYGQAQNALGQAGQAIQRAGEFDPVNQNVTNAVNRMAASAGSGGGYSGPQVDRVRLAQNALSRFQEARAPEFDRQIRGVGQAAAAFGRTGSGMTTNDLTDVLSQQQGAQRRFEGQILDDALAASVQDAISAYNAGTQRMGVQGQNLSSLANIDQRGREFGANTALGQAGAYGNLAQGFAGLDDRRRGNLATGIGMGQNLSNQLFGQERDLRQETYGMERDAIQDRINETLLENQLSGTAFDRAMQWMNSIGGMSGMDEATFNQIMGMLG